MSFFLVSFFLSFFQLDASFSYFHDLGVWRVGELQVTSLGCENVFPTRTWSLTKDKGNCGVAVFLYNCFYYIQTAAERGDICCP